MCKKKEKIVIYRFEDFCILSTSNGFISLRIEITVITRKEICFYS